MAKERDTRATRGERLKRLRKAKGLSLEQVHQRTKIHVQVLKALEEDKLDGISPAYLKGLLKIYGNLLGIDPKDLTQEHPQEPPQEPAQEPPKPPKAEQEALEIPLEKPQVNISVIKEQVKLKPIIFSICLLLLAMLAFKIGKSVSVQREQSSSQKSLEPAVVSKQLEVPSPASVSTKPRLGIRAKQDCWLEVKTNGKTIFRGILKKGDFEYWEAEEEIEFSLGNAGGVDVEVNNKLLPSLGRRGQVIKNILVTKEGLAVPSK